MIEPHIVKDQQISQYFDTARPNSRPDSEVFRQAKEFAFFIASRREKIIKILTCYETYHVAVDEISRTLDLFQNLEENKAYFRGRVKTIVSFLPVNQPFYALSCFGLIQTFISRDVYARPAAATRGVIRELVKELELEKYFPNLYISFQQRKQFVEQHSKNPDGIDVVIFTGKPDNALSLQKILNSKLFIGNGASHNPVVISDGADLNKAVDSIVEVQLYNQGGDCAAPNAILVTKSYYQEFLSKLRSSLKKVGVGPYSDPSILVGPLVEKKHLREVEERLQKNKEWIDPETPGIIRLRDGIVEPTIIAKPLCLGGNYEEWYAPVFTIQVYEKDEDLKKYFETKKYADNAGYITIFGHSPYIESLIGKISLYGKILHDEKTIIRNTHLHASGIERGVRPYGGYGKYSSFIIFNNHFFSKPTLPQRDIYECLLKNKIC